MTTKTVTGTIQEVNWDDERCVQVTILQPGAGKAPNGKKWPEHYKGWQPDDLDLRGLDLDSVGETWTLTLEESQNMNSRGNPYWNLLQAKPSRKQPEPEEPIFDDEPEPPYDVEHREPKESTESHFAGPPAKDDVQVRIEKGMAFNGAVALTAPLLLDDIDAIVQNVRALRDRLYHEVILVPIAPAQPKTEAIQDAKDRQRCEEHNNAPFIDGKHPVHEIQGNQSVLVGWCYADERFNPVTETNDDELPF